MKTVNILTKIIYTILLLLSIILFGLIIYLNIIPYKYIVPMIIIYLIVLLLMAIVAFKNSFKLWIKISVNIISLVLSGLIITILVYLNTTLNFMDKIKASKYQIEEYYVIVNNDSTYNDIEQLNNKKLGIYDDISGNLDKSLNKLKETVNLEENKYNDFFEASYALMNTEIDVIVLSSSYKAIIEDIIKDFSSKTKIIYTIEIKIENEIENNEVNVTKEAFNIYLSGIDIFGSISLISRSDVNMVITINPNTHKILLTSIPRDYYVQLHGTTGYKDKLTHAGIYGINMSIKTVEDLLEESMDYYARVNFTTLINLVDAIGGIDIYSDTAFTAWGDRDCKFKVGTQHVGGKCALAFARERHAYTEGDRHRVQNQQDVIKAIINKTLSSKTLITKYSKILDSMSSSFQTNMPSNNIYDLINMQLDTMSNWDIESYSLDGTDSSGYTYSSGSELLYVMEPNYESIQIARYKINQIIEGR